MCISIDTLMERGDTSQRYHSRLSKRDLYDFNVLESKEDYVTSMTGKGYKPIPDRLLAIRGPWNRTISCPALFDGDPKEVQKAKDYMIAHPRTSIKDADYIAMTKDCKHFRSARGYFSEPLSQEEADFPIAFSILMYKNVEQIERLLRAIYMPQNFYCIHIDTKASDEVHLAVRALARCFPNVFVASKLESIFWAHISILIGEMNCLGDLMKYQWKYYINLSGQMFPLQTNRNLVRILKLYNGANDVEGTIER